MKKVFAILSSLLISISLAQYTSQEWGLAILSLLFGPLPTTCGTEITPDCLKCLGALKLMPFIFFFSIFFFTFYFVFLQAFGRVEVKAGPLTESRPGELSSTGRKIAVLISLALSVSILHFQTIQTSFKQVIFWSGVAFMIVIAVFVYALFRIQSPPIIVIIIMLAILLGFFGYIWSYLSPSIEEWESLCL